MKQPPKNPNFNEESLKDIMRFFAGTENDERVTISNDTPLNAVLSASDGYSEITSSKIRFYTEVQVSLWKAGQPEPKWPENWLELTIGLLAQNLYTQTLTTNQ